MKLPIETVADKVKRVANLITPVPENCTECCHAKFLFKHETEYGGAPLGCIHPEAETPIPIGDTFNEMKNGNLRIPSCPIEARNKEVVTILEKEFSI